MSLDRSAAASSAASPAPFALSALSSGSGATGTRQHVCYNKIEYWRWKKFIANSQFLSLIVISDENFIANI